MRGDLERRFPLVQGIIHLETDILLQAAAELDPMVNGETSEVPR